MDPPQVPTDARPQAGPAPDSEPASPVGGVAASCPGNPHSLPVSGNVAAARAARLRVPQETASEPARGGSTPNKTLLRRKPQYSEAQGATGAVPNIRRRRPWAQRLGCSVSVLSPEPATVAGDRSPPCLSLSARARSQRSRLRSEPRGAKGERRELLLLLGVL